MTKISIQGIAFDEKSSYQQGPKLAPPLIRKALHSGSLNLFAENGISIENASIADQGDFEIANYFDITQITEEHLNSSSKVFTLIMKVTNILMPVLLPESWRIGWLQDLFK